MLSVIIPTCNRNELLSKCLDKLAPFFQLSCAEAYEVIVTDDSKSCAAENLIQCNFLWAKYIKGPKKGPAANRNNGAKHAKGQWLVFIDDDCVPDKNLLQEYLNGINDNPNCLAFEGAIFPDDEKLLKKDMAECPVNTKGGCFWSANICINANLFKEIGGFNEDYLIAAQEDQQMKIDIVLKTKQKIVFLQKAKITHPVRFAGLKDKVFKIPAISKNFCLYAIKNKSVLGYNSLYNFIIQQIIFHIRVTLACLKKAHVKSLLFELMWLSWGIPLNAIHFYNLERKQLN